MIVAQVIYYRPGAEALDRLLRSLEAHGVEGLVAADGPFKGVSRDVKTVRAEWDVLRGFKGRKVLIAPQVWPSEPVKRTVCARMAWQHLVRPRYGHHHILSIDADEELLTDIELPQPGKLGVAKVYVPERPVLAEEYGEAAVLHIRLHELSAGLTWGPSHFEATSHGIRYSMPHCRPGTSSHQLEIMHHPVPKSAAYRRYNEQRRMLDEVGVDRLGQIPTWGLAASSETINVHLPGIEAPSEQKVRNLQALQRLEQGRS